jgi:membrane-associated phospholipid phosphatase
VKEQILASGIEFIQMLQAWRNPVFDFFFKAITLLGNEQFFVLAVPLLWFALDLKLAKRLSYTIIFSAAINEGLKAYFALPRPFVSHPELGLVHASGFSLPSGHAQVSAVFWGILALELSRLYPKKKNIWPLALFMIFVVGLSRSYLGVHYPTDIALGWSIGILIALVYSKLSKLEATKFKIPLLLTAVASVVGICFVRLPSLFGLFSAVLGLSCGVLLHQRENTQAQAPSLEVRFKRAGVGIVSVLILYFGLKLCFSAVQVDDSLYYPLRFIRYALVGIWVSYLGQKLCAKCGQYQEVKL